MPVWIVLGRITALFCGKFTDLLQAIFLREIFALLSLIFSGKASAPQRRRLEYEISSSLLFWTCRLMQKHT